MIRNPLTRALLTSAALCVATMLAGCNTDSVVPWLGDKANRPLSEKMVKDIQSKNMDMESPILVRLFKDEAELEIWKQDRSGQLALLKTYPICRWSGELGPKIKEGDRQAPEGFYNITPGQMNPNSQYYLSFDLGYPNAYDRSWGRTGAQLMVHGDCSSRGCYSMTDEQISEIYALGRDAFFGGQKSFQVQAYPFRMTAQNLAKHRNSPHMAFWKMLKKGNDHFEVSHQEPKVSVCEKRYVFDAVAPDGSARPLSFNASAKCPAFQVSENIASAVIEKQRKDEYETAELVRRGVATAPVRTYADGGMNQVFVNAVKNNQIGVGPQESTFLASAPPGTIPPTVRPPRIPELANAPVVAGVAPTPHPELGTQPPQQMAIADMPAAAPQPAAKSNGFLGSLFAKVGLTPAEKKIEAAAMAPPPPAPKPKPAAKPATATANGAIRPRQPEPAPTKTADAQTAAPTPARVAAAQPAPPNTAMNGSAPVVPAGNFDSRWSGFR